MSYSQKEGPLSPRLLGIPVLEGALSSVLGSLKYRGKAFQGPLGARRAAVVLEGLYEILACCSGTF